MTLFGLDESHVRRLVTAVSGRADLDERELADRFARAAWSVVTEPGDGTAGAIIQSMGAAEALQLVLHHSGRSDRVQEPTGDPQAAVAETVAVHSDLRSGLERWRPRLRSADVERALSLAARVGARMLVPNAPGEPWPAGVEDLGPHAPIALWMRGSPRLLADAPTGIALVGARAATGYGEHVAGELSAGLVELGYSVVSGAAYGIDGMAHRAALAADGLTLAFLAGGVDRFYPAGHDELLRRITERGLVLSELPCGAAPTKWRFLQRNRLIAASSAATVVVEAGARSGSLNTAGHASALGRPLGAVPGPVTSPASAGCHRLLREYDAVCVTDAREVAELVTPLASTENAATRATEADRDSPDTLRVLDALTTRNAHAPDEIAARSGLAIGAVLGALGVLQIEGRAREDATGWRAVPRKR
ncbi:DNA-processing protein DprA [Rathayibacter sp. KR2-224]|uniref:DNA-processing protein DprA n=1 Tax=Rathayibacter sp. KR2-224 TaxID=3400913 RepID=UPI003C087FC4